MAPSLEEIRQIVIGAYKTMHDTYFSSVPVEYPNFAVADREHLTGPYASVDIDLARGMEQFGVGDTSLIVKGRLVLYYLYTENTGMNGVGTYLDRVKDTFCYKTLSGVNYQEMVVYNVFPGPGIVGQKAEVRFVV